MLDARHYSADVILKDGASAHIRAIRPDDRAALVEHFSTLSARSIRFRFFSSKSGLTERELDGLVAPDFVEHVGLVLTQRWHNTEVIIGVGRYFVDPASRPRRAEVAFAVSDIHQGRGVGTLLFDHLHELARDAGIEELEAYVLGENKQMIEVFAASGLVIERTFDGGSYLVRMKTRDDEISLHRREEREHGAARRSIIPILEPRSIAVLGSPREPIVFRGSVYHAIAELCGPVDLAIIAAPRAIESALEDCASNAVCSVVVLARDPGDATRLHDRAREAGMRLVGPGSLGLINTDPRIALNACARSFAPRAGEVAVMARTEASILEGLQARRAGISSFVSIGEAIDVSAIDLLAYWRDDPRTRVIALDLEKLSDPGALTHLAQLAAEISPVKKIVALAREPAQRSLLQPAGVRCASSVEELLALISPAQKPERSREVEHR